jgi:hypothetical protein
MIVIDSCIRGAIWGLKEDEKGIVLYSMVGYRR